jgi:superfamily II DNA/RNA helicase
MPFSDLGLSAEVVRAVTDAGYSEPTPIQAQAIPTVLAGRDVLGCAQTGTGKTASFTLPMIDVLASGRGRARMPRSLILEPTRELAAQVGENFEKYGKYNKLTMALLIGGVSLQDQAKLLTRGVDVLIATPGRLIDHIERGSILLTDVKILVIDEADRMLDMGFIPDVERIVGMLPVRRQTLFFSATMPPEIKRLADAFLTDPKTITVSAPSSTAKTVTQLLVPVSDANKREALRKLIISEEVRNAIVFCNRKRDVSLLHKALERSGLNVGALHGDMVQSARTETLERFKAGDIAILIASDVAARGLDVADLSHVFNFDVPFHTEDYIHRIGRTGRAGKSGKAFTLMSPSDAKALAAIEKLTGQTIERISVPGLEDVGEAVADEAPRRGRSRRGAKEEARPAPTEALADSSVEPRAEPRRGRRGRSGPPAEQPSILDSPPPIIAAEQSISRGDRSDRGDRGDRGFRSERGRGREGMPYEERRPRRYRDDDLGPPVVGLGDHVPAFLLRAVKLPKPTADVEAG